MKKFIPFLITSLWAVMAFSGGLDKVVMKIDTVSTNATKSEVSSQKITGYIERIDVAFGVTTNTCHMKIFSSNANVGATTTLRTEVIKSTNFTFNPSTLYQQVDEVSVSPTGTVKRILAFDEKIYLIATNAPIGLGNQSIVATIIYERP